MTVTDLNQQQRADVVAVTRLHFAGLPCGLVVSSFGQMTSTC